MKAIAIHELASMVPLANPLEQEALNKSVSGDGFDKKLGLIKLWKGSIIDGRCRQIALIKAELDPRDYAEEVVFGTFEEAERFVLKANQRRNLTKTQKAIVAYMLTKKSGSSKKITQEEACRLFEVSRTTIQTVSKLVQITKESTFISYYRITESEKSSKLSFLENLIDDLFQGCKVEFDGFDRPTDSISQITKHLKRVKEGNITEKSAFDWNPDSNINTEAGKQWFKTQTESEQLSRNMIMHLVELANFKFAEGE